MNNQATKKRQFFKHYKKIFANEFRGYNASYLIKDVLAGMTVGAVALPLALAFGAASVNAQNAAIGISAGLITAIITGIVTGMLGGGSFQISGPTGAMTVVLASVVASQYGLMGMFLACFLAGAIMFIAGLLKFGKLVQFIPRPVVTGFTSGIAIIIALGQVGNFFGVSLNGSNTIGKVIDFCANSLGDINYIAVICSLAVVLIMAFFPKKWSKYIPGSLVAIIIITVVSIILKFDINKIGSIPTSLINSEHLTLGVINLEMVRDIIPTAVTIATLGMIESLLCGTCAANMKKEKFDSNVELVAQGIGNMVVPFFGGVPSTAAIARTSVAINSGGRTRLTSVFQSFFLLLCMFVFSKAIGEVPYGALAGVLVVTAFRMNEWHSINYYFKNKLWDAVAMFVITMVATVFLDLTYAVLIGVGVSVIMLVINLSKIDVETSTVELADGTTMENTIILYSTGAMFFANAKELPKKLERLKFDYEHYIFSFRGIIYIDVTSVDTLSEMIKDLQQKGKKYSFTDINPSVWRVLERTGFIANTREDNYFTSIDKVFIEHEVLPAVAES